MDWIVAVSAVLHETRGEDAESDALREEHGESDDVREEPESEMNLAELGNMSLAEFGDCECWSNRHCMPYASHSRDHHWTHHPCPWHAPDLTREDPRKAENLARLAAFAYTVSQNHEQAKNPHHVKEKLKEVLGNRV